MTQQNQLDIELKIREKEEVEKFPLADFQVLLRMWNYIRDLDEEIS